MGLESTGGEPINIGALFELRISTKEALKLKLLLELWYLPLLLIPTSLDK